MSGKFFPVSDSDKKALFEKVGEHLPPGYKDSSYCKVLKAKLPFYPEWDSYEVHKEEDVTTAPVTFFTKSDRIQVLDWQPKTILEFNKEAPLVLSIHDIAAYVQFYFSHTRVRDGRMEIISAYDDFKWREEPMQQVKKALASLLRAPHLISWDEENHSYEVAAHILFQNNLFECRLYVNRLGEIEVKERTLQVEDMPLIDPETE